jgi:hypothetical protein
MSNLTQAETVAIREELERKAASLLGKTVFCFSRMDMNVGLMVSSVLRWSGKESQLKGADTMNFHARLKFLENYVESRGDLVEEARSALRAWIAAADAVRVKRNDFFHGRWSVDGPTGKVRNTTGLPGSDAQESKEYTLIELDAFNSEIERLTPALSKLRARWKLP